MKKSQEKRLIWSEHYVCLNLFAENLTQYGRKVAFGKTLDEFIDGHIQKFRLHAGDSDINIEFCSRQSSVGFLIDIDVNPKKIEIARFFQWLVESKYKDGIDLDFTQRTDGAVNNKVKFEICYRSNTPDFISQFIDFAQDMIAQSIK